MIAKIIDKIFFCEFFYVYVFIFLTILFIVLSVIVRKTIFKKIFLFLFSIFFAFFVVEYVLFLKTQKINLNAGIELTREILNENFDISKLNNNQHSRYKINGKDVYFWNTNLKNDVGTILVFNVHETTYQNRFRYTQSNIKNSLDYVFLGCSFMYGLGLEDTQTLPYFFSKNLNYKYGVLNCGVPGRSSNTALSILKSNLLDKFSKKDQKIKHFIYMCINEHINRNFTDILSCKSSDNYVYDNNKFVKNEQPFEFFINTFIKSYIFKKFFLNRIEDKNKNLYEDYFIDSLNKMDIIVREKYNSKFTVLFWNDAYSNFKKDFLRKIQKTNLDFIVLPTFDYSYIIPYDSHPNAKANEEIAKILLKHFED